MRALLLLLSLALAGDPSLADLDAAAARARALSISGPAPGQVLTRKEEGALLTAQLKARALAVQDAERIAMALIQSGDPQLQVAALLRMGWVEIGLGEAIRDSYVPTWLTPEEEELYHLGLEDRVFATLDNASGFVLQAEKLVQPGSPESGEVWRLWLILRHDPGPAEKHVCAPPPPPKRGRDPRATIGELKARLDHLQSDIQTYEGCLPPDLVAYARDVAEQTAPVIAERDTSMAADVQTFVDELSSQLHEALPSACDVRDHLAPASSTPTAPPAISPQPPGLPHPTAAPEITDLNGLRAALELAARAPQDAPQPICPRGPPTEPTGLRLGALRSVEQSAQGLTDPAAHQALAAAYTAASRDLNAHLPAAGLIAASAEAVRQRDGARWAAARADAHLEAILQDPGATEADRSRVLAELESLTRYRLMLQAMDLPEPIDPRRVEY